MLTPPVYELFAPYLTLNLAAFDNVKLVVAVLVDKGEECHALTAVLTRDDNQETAYLVRWKQHFIYCGKVNSYGAKLDEISSLSSIDAQSIEVVQAPVLSMQQVSFMCMENAHFDHC